VRDEVQLRRGDRRLRRADAAARRGVRRRVVGGRLDPDGLEGLAGHLGRAAVPERPARQVRAEARRCRGMKAAVFYEAERLEVEDVPEPEAGSDEVVVRVLACGFCGSDVEYYYGKSPLGTPDGKGPLVLGHELCGEVVEVGSLGERSGIAEGDRVSVNPVQSCNACNACRAGKVAFCQNLSVLGVTTNGGFAEFAKTKIAHAYKLPDSLTDEQGAFVEMLSSAVYAVRRAEVEPGNFAVVYGPGPVGLSMVQLLKNEGARVALVGTRDYRLDI